MAVKNANANANANDRVKGLPNNPFVSVITPTFNRRRFIPYLIECYKSQTYSKEYMEWIILDDGTDPVGDLFTNLKIPNIRYIHEEEKQNIGAKRNRLNKEAKGDIIIAMDDDDFYFPERVAHTVHMLRSRPGIELAGASEVYMYYTDIKTIYKLGPYNNNHATNGTMAWLKSYADKHIYDESVTHAEEKSFLDNYKNPMIQLNPMKVMLVLSHSENTFDKKKLREQAEKQNSDGTSANPFIKKTVMKIKDFIKDSKLREFYSNA
jgi:glycosyltransferase involved in cell wall biosynthesis